MAIFVERESLTTKARHVTLTWTDKDNGQRIVGSGDSLPTIDVNHLRLHEGRAYYIYKMFPLAAGLASGASVDIAIAWPSGVQPHAVFAYESSGPAEFYVYENPTTSGGTAMTIHRRNRINTTASTAAAVLTPTVTSLGTEIYSEFVPAGKSGGAAAYTFEYVLKPLTTYLFRLTNVDNQTNPAELRIEWYE
jgi:hypothetical protein